MDSTVPTPLHLTRLTGSHLYFFNTRHSAGLPVWKERWSWRRNENSSSRVYSILFRTRADLWVKLHTHTHTTKSYLLRRPLSDWYVYRYQQRTALCVEPVWLSSFFFFFLVARACLSRWIIVSWAECGVNPFLFVCEDNQNIWRSVNWTLGIFMDSRRVNQSLYKTP